MPSLLVFLYLVLTTAFPQDLIAGLGEYRVPFWTGTIGLVVGAAALTVRGLGFVRLPQFWALMGFTTVMAVSTIVGNGWFGAPAMVVAAFSGSLTIFMLIIWNVNSLSRMKWTAAGFVVAIVALCVQGLYSYTTGWDSWRVLNVYTDTDNGQERFDNDEAYEAIRADLQKKGDAESEQALFGIARAAAVAEGRIGTRIRGNGVLQDPNDFAQAMLVALPFCWLAYKKGKRLQNLLVVVAPTALIVITLYYTKSRGGAIGLLALLAIRFWGRMSTFKTIALIGVMGALMVATHFTGGRAISADDESSEGRLAAWGQGFSMVRTDPILGVGYARFVDYNNLTAHNSYVLCFAETGLAGYFCWLTILVATLLHLSMLKKIDGADELSEGIRRWAGTLQLSLGGFLVTAFFLSRTYVFVPYMIIAMVCALVLIGEANGIRFTLPRLGNLIKLTLIAEVSSMCVLYAIVSVARLTGAI